MITLLFFSFLSGLVTIFAPCIWPLLPIILSSSTTGGKQKALGITLGIMLSFAFFTLSISYIISVIPFDSNNLRLVAVTVISFLGLTLIIPQLTQLLEGAVSRVSSNFNISRKLHGDSFGTGFITGFSLGIVWTPCAGPILATIATLAATQSVSLQIILVTIVYVIGVGIPLFIFTLLGNRIFTKSKLLSRYTARIQQIFGVIMILTALAILTNFDKTLQARLLDIFPSYSNFITKLESGDAVTKQLGLLRNSVQNSITDEAPEFQGIENWINSNPLTMKELKGKVVLIDFWTYTCINCIRTLPYLTSWDKKYRDKGLVIVGVHTPEFEFEKNTENVEKALQQYNIKYPVAQDNEYSTWNAYSNQYWPAKYLIDAQGKVRYTHFGEGAYEETEKIIQDLLKESGAILTDSSLIQEKESEYSSRTPETYVGLARMAQVTNRINSVGSNTFTLSKNIPQDALSFGGTWNIQQEYAEAEKDSDLALNFNAQKVFLVITPRQRGQKVEVFLDEKRYKTITLDEARLYEILSLEKSDKHILRLRFLESGIQVFAFTFG